MGDSTLLILKQGGDHKSNVEVDVDWASVGWDGGCLNQYKVSKY